MFERCRFRGASVALDGVHERVLCETHVNGLKDALAQPGMFEITWGLWPHEKRKLDEARLAKLLLAYPERPAHPGWSEDEAVREFLESESYGAGKRSTVSNGGSTLTTTAACQWSGSASELPIDGLADAPRPSHQQRPDGAFEEVDERVEYGVRVVGLRPDPSRDRGPDDGAGDSAAAPTSSDGPASVGRTVVVGQFHREPPSLRGSRLHSRPV